MVQFKKLRKNPLSLGSVVITDSNFNDENLDEVALLKLDNAIKSGLVEVVKGDYVAPKKQEVKTVEVTDDNTLVALKDDNAKITKKLEVQVSLNEEAKQLVNDTLSKVDEMVEIVDGLKALINYEEMEAEDLAKDFTVEELTFIATKLHGLEIKSNTKEATIASKIVEALSTGK